MDVMPSPGPYALTNIPQSNEYESDPTQPSTLNLLDSLVSFYHQERMWVYRTRASLELVLEAAPTNSSESGSSHTAESDSTFGDKGAVVLRSRGVPGVKQEPMDTPNLNGTLWMRRKKSFKMKLEGISTRTAKRRRLSFSGGGGGSSDQEELPTPGIQILELFENMMQARMESCERVSRLVKDAHNSQFFTDDV